MVDAEEVEHADCGRGGIPSLAGYPPVGGKKSERSAAEIRGNSDDMTVRVVAERAFGLAAMGCKLGSRRHAGATEKYMEVSVLGRLVVMSKVIIL
jgi:hypothetical protein